MNKSKFLKKSLAIVLSVMMVVAMIPLSASAAATNHAFVNTNGVQTIDTSVSADTLTTVTAGTEYTVTKLYSATGTYTVDVVTMNGYDKLFTKVYDKDGEADDEYTEVSATSTVNISINEDDTKVEFFAAKADYDYDEDEGTKGTVVTVNFEQPKASTSYALKSAVLGSSATDTSAIAGTIDNTKKTVSFTVPWGYQLGSNKVYAVMENPVTGSDVTAVAPTIDGETAVAMAVTNQAGNTTNFKVYATEEDCLAGVTVGGVEAVREPSKTGGVIDKDDDGNIIYTDDYTVTLPLGTKLSTTAADTVVKYTMASGVTKVASATWGTAGTSSDAAFTNGTKQILADGTKYYLTLTSKAGTTKQYTVTVNVAQSNEAEITGFEAKVTLGSDDYTENGTVTGDKLNVVLPKNADLTSVGVAFTTSTGATVAIDSVTPDSNGVFTLNLTNPVIVTVTAADGTTKKVYELSATKAEALQGNPTISAVKMTIGTGDDAVDYSATVDNSKYVITFSGLPYATTEADVQDATVAWAKSQGTSLGTVAFETASDKDIFTGKNTVAITSDNGEVNTYTIVFAKNAAKTGKDISSLEFTYATKSDKVTSDNTVKATVNNKKKEITFTLPYSFDNGAAKDIVPVFTVSEGAKVYFNDFTTKTNVDTTAVESGFYADDHATSAKAPKHAVAAADITKLETIVVANESAVYELAEATANSTTVAITDLATTTYKKNVVVYTVKVEYADPQEGNVLNKFTANEGKVTSKITHDTEIEITVPASYVGGAAFFADIEASKLASVKGASTDLIVDDKTVDISTTPVAGALRVVDDTASGATEKAYGLEVYTGSTWADVTTIVVTSESGSEVNNYTVTVKAADAKTGADLTSVTVAGVKATIDTAARTAKVVLPFGTDLTDVIVAYEASELATVTTNLPAVTDDDEAEHYDLTSTLTFTVEAEDGNTVKVYTLTVTTASQFSDVDATAYYADDVYTAASKGIIKGYANGTFKPNNNITRRDFAIMVTRMLNADTSSYTTAAFPDVKSGDYGLAAIAYCSDKGIITGRPNGKFAPDEYISRQDAAIILARALELTSTATSTEFKDNAKIRTDAVASVAAASAAGIIVGDANGNFRPTDNIKRCDAAVMMVRALNK